MEEQRGRHGASQVTRSAGGGVAQGGGEAAIETVLMKVGGHSERRAHPVLKHESNLILFFFRQFLVSSAGIDQRILCKKIPTLKYEQAF